MSQVILLFARKGHVQFSTSDSENESNQRSEAYSCVKVILVFLVNMFGTFLRHLRPMSTEEFVHVFLNFLNLKNRVMTSKLPARNGSCHTLICELLRNSLEELYGVCAKSITQYRWLTSSPLGAFTRIV